MSTVSTTPTICVRNWRVEEQLLLKAFVNHDLFINKIAKRTKAHQLHDELTLGCVLPKFGKYSNYG